MEQTIQTQIMMQTSKINNQHCRLWEIMMTTIPLIKKDNYISFPSAAPFGYNFKTLFTESGIINDISSFYRYDPIQEKWVSADMDFESIQKGKGYYITINTPPSQIVYDGTDYNITIDELRSNLVKGGPNLVGTGINTIYIPSWCRVIDADTQNYTTTLEPMKAYWIYYDDCVEPTFTVESAIVVIGSIGTVLFTYWLLKEFKIIK